MNIEFARVRDVWRFAADMVADVRWFDRRGDFDVEEYRQARLGKIAQWYVRRYEGIYSEYRGRLGGVRLTYRDKEYSLQIDNREGEHVLNLDASLDWLQRVESVSGSLDQQLQKEVELLMVLRSSLDLLSEREAAQIAMFAGK